MSIPGSVTPLFNSGGVAAAGGYQIERSLRFNSSDSAYLSRTPASAGNRQNWTWSGWVKRSNPDTGVRQVLFSAYGASNDTGFFEFGFDNGPNLNKFYWTQWSVDAQSAAVFRDFSAWCHILVNYNGSNIVVYVNGTSVLTSAKTGDLAINGTFEHGIGRQPNSGRYFSGYIADIYFIDGQALTPSSFTEVSATTGQLIPKAYTGTYGTNGFKLTFSDNSNTTATTLGKDTSGNSNNWTPVNLSAGSSVIYSSNVTTVATSIYNGDLATMFDGSTTTYYGVTSSSGNSSISVNLTGKNVSVSSSVRVYGSYRNGMVWQINGSTVSSSGVTHPNTGWQTLSGWSAGAITSISVSVPSGSANEIYAFEVDGIILTNTGPGNDSLVDTPTSYGTDTGAGGEVRGNYCTWNPLQSSAATLTNGNLDCTTAVVTGAQTRGTIAVSTGKWYWEILVNTTAAANNIGIIKTSEALSADRPGFFAGGYNYVGFSGNKENNASASSYGATYGAGDVIGVVLDLDAGTLVFYKNGTSQGTAFSSLSGEFIPAIGDGTGGSGMDISANFGQRAFAYQTPGTNRPAATFLALCDTNLGAPVVAKPNTVMDVALYTGNGTTRTVSGLGFSPDFVWLRNRTQASNWVQFDTVRGVLNRLCSNLTVAEASLANSLTSFDSTGFTYGSEGSGNNNGDAFAAFCWDAGTSTVTNTQGSITSSVRANASAGFSVVTYTATGSTLTVGHGLGVAPELIIIKGRTSTASWAVYTKAVGTSAFLLLNTTAAVQNFNVWNNTSPTSTVFTVGAPFDEGNTAGVNHVAYCFAPVVGYSSFGTWLGSGTTDNGAFIYTGFRPRFILLKNTDNVEQWYIYDSSRSPYNVSYPNLTFLNPNTAASEGSYLNYATIDFVSNGFKIRGNTGSEVSFVGRNYIYACFAESPFQYARAR